MIVYVATNKLNGKQYVGITTRTLEARMRQHINRAKRPDTKPFHRALAKYGECNFSFKVVATAKTWKALCTKEAQWIKKLKSRTVQGGYNLTPGGDGLHDPSPETLAKLRNHIPWNKGKKLTPCHKARISAGLVGNQNTKGLVNTPEYCAAMSARLKGRVLTPTHKARISA